MSTAEFTKQRIIMVEKHLKGRDISDPRVLEVMGDLPREAFVPKALQERAYEDSPLPIGSGQTISQPYVVALMTQLLGIKPTDKILEIGTGSGYQAAILSKLAAEVYTIEILEPLTSQARDTLNKLGIKNVRYKVGDGYQGWNEFAPFDKILLTAAPPAVPPPLIEQLKVGGKLIAPIGEYSQYLKVYEKTTDGKLKEVAATPVRFVPMVGEAQKR